MSKKSNRNSRSREPVELTIDRLSHEGRGIAVHEGRVVFVEGALPGERVMARITGTRSTWAEAVTEELLTKSTERVDPPCPHYGVCGGCALQHLDSRAQLAFKERMVHEKLSHSAGTDQYEVLPVISSNTEGYRRKARLAVRHVSKKERVLVGFRERHSSFIADMQSCVVLETRVGKLLPELAALVSSMQASRLIPQIEVAVGDFLPGQPSHALVFRHLAPLAPADLLQLEQFGQAQDIDIYLQPKGPETVHKHWPAGSPERLYYSQPHFGLEFAFHPMDFTQVNAGVNQAMVIAAIGLLELQADDGVLDLFSGLGNFTLPLATRAAHVTGVEGVDAMVLRGQENAARNGIDNVSFLRADLAAPPAQHAWLRQGFDKVLLDPPRSGALEVLPAVVTAAPGRIVYVSCNPATLARDTEYLQENGYRLKAAGAMDMFPHTSHVEAMALFVPKRR
jgi:23S rRNA (uracil1939-C5)-methyltransferase